MKVAIERCYIYVTTAIAGRRCAASLGAVNFHVFLGRATRLMFNVYVVGD